MSAEDRRITKPQEILSTALADYRTLVGILYDQGYFSPVVSIKVDEREAANIPPLDAPSQITRIDITVDTGRKFTFGEAAIAPLASGTVIPEGYAPGQTASTRAIQNAARTGVEGWENVGHPKADIGDTRIVANNTRAELNANIEVIPGPLLRFGNVTVSGNEDVDTSRILRIAGFPTGKVYDPDLVRKVGTRLRRTGAFSSVAIKEADEPNPDGTLDFEIVTAERLPRRISFGAKVETDNGLELTAGWMHRNFLGGADRLAFDARIRNIGGAEDIDGLIALRLDRPTAFGADFDHFYLTELEILDEPFYRVERLLIGTGVRRIFSDELFAELAITASYVQSYDDVFDDREFYYFLLPSRVEWDKRDNKVNATDGFYVDVRAMPFAGFNDTETGMRVFADTRGYIGFGDTDRVVLAGRLQLGSIVGASLAGISPDLTFVSGGAGTVRGQPYQSLGIEFPDGTISGRAFFGTAAEVRTKITDRISVVGFYDFGAVDEDSFIGEDSENHSGAGLGVRYDLGGLGPLRLDLGWPVSGNTGDGLQFYLGIGQAF